MIQRSKVLRSKPWFGVYYFCAQKSVKWAHALRTLNHAHIDRTLSYYRRWPDIHVNYGGSWRTAAGHDQQTLEDLYSLCDFLQTQKDRKVVVQADHVYVYSNDVSFLERLGRFPIGKFLGLSEVELRGDPDAVNLRSSKYLWRSYFRTQKIADNTRESLRSYLETQADTRIGPGLQHAFDTRCVRLHEYYFIDHNHAATINMLCLISPDLIRRTLPIVVHK